MRGLHLSLGVLALLLSFNSSATFRFLHNSALVELDGEETASLRAFCSEALNQIADSEKVVWRSETSDAVGMFKAVASFSFQQRDCRRGVVALRKNNKKDLYRIDYCRYGDEWKHTQTPIMYLSDEEKQDILDRVHFLLSSEMNKHPMTWQNKKRSVFGSFVVLPSEEQTAKVCKDVAASLSSTNGAEITGVYEFCQVGDIWRYTRPVH